MRGSITKFLVVLCILFYPGKVFGIGISTGIDVLSVRADVEMLQDELHVRVEDSRPLQSPGRHLHHIWSVATTQDSHEGNGISFLPGNNLYNFSQISVNFSLLQFLGKIIFILDQMRLFREY